MLEKDKNELKQRRRDKLEKRLARDKMHLRPGPIDYPLEIEKRLMRTATRGTVSLFNAVRKQQKDESGAISGDVQSLSKTSFLNMLSTGAKVEKNKTSDGAGAVKQWDVLSDKYMMGSAMKNWTSDDKTQSANEVLEDLSDLDSDSEMFDDEDQAECEREFDDEDD